MVGRVPCGVCNLQSSSPNNFLLVCACGVACHHKCLQPPMAYSSLLVMIDAFNRGVHEKSISAWLCAACIGTTSTLRNQSLPPVSAQPPVLIDKQVQCSPGRHEKKNVVSGRVREWHKYAPAPVKPSQSRLRIDSSAAAWPPVRHKNKIHTHPSVIEDIGKPVRKATSLKLNAGHSKQVESTYKMKSFSRLYSPTTKGLRPKPKLNPLHTSVPDVKTLSTGNKSRTSMLRKYVGGSLASPYPSGSTLAQTTATIIMDHTVSPATRKCIVKDNISKKDLSMTTSNTLPRKGDGVEGIFIDYRPVNSAGSGNNNVTQVSFPVLPSTTARDLYDLPSSPTAHRRRNKRKYFPDAAIHSMSRETPGHTPSVVPPRWRPPLIDLHKALKRKRSTVRRNPTATSIRSNSGVPEPKWDVASVSRQDSGFDGHPLKRRKLDMGNTEKPEIQNSGGKLSVPTQEQIALALATDGKHINSVDSALQRKAQTDERLYEFSPIIETKRRKLDVQTSQATMTSQPRLYPSDAEIRHLNAAHHTNDETNQIPQLASPATSHRSVEAVPPDDSRDSPPREAKPVPPSVTVLSPPETLPPIDQIVTEPHLLPTPRSLSPPRHPVVRSVLDDVVARLQLQHRHRDHLQPPKLHESKVKLPQLAKWFKGLGTNLTSTGTCDKRRRWKTPNPKAMMVGLSEGWSFVGAHVRTTR